MSDGAKEKANGAGRLVEGQAGLGQMVGQEAEDLSQGVREGPARGARRDGEERRTGEDPPRVQEGSSLIDKLIDGPRLNVYNSMKDEILSGNIRPLFPIRTVRGDDETPVTVEGQSYRESLRELRQKLVGAHAVGHDRLMSGQTALAEESAKTVVRLREAYAAEVEKAFRLWVRFSSLPYLRAWANDAEIITHLLIRLECDITFHEARLLGKEGLDATSFVEGSSLVPPPVGVTDEFIMRAGKLSGYMIGIGPSSSSTMPLPALMRYCRAIKDAEVQNSLADIRQKILDERGSP
jgi:hypothetical protein